MKKILGASWRTSTVGLILIVWSIYTFHLLWVSTHSVWFNLTHVETGPIAMFFTGLMALLARDHKTTSEEAGAHKPDSQKQ